MTLTSFQGFAVTFDAFDNPIGGDPQTSITIAAPPGTAFSYTVVGTAPDELPLVAMNWNADSIALDGHPLPGGIAQTHLGVLTWGGGLQTLVLEIIVPGAGGQETSYVFPLAGDPVPQITSLAQFLSIESSITSATVATGPFAPGQPIVWETVPNATPGGTLLGTLADDVLAGSPAADWIEGNDGNDTLLGDTGNDTLIGGHGIDSATGAGGADIFAFAIGDGTLIINDFEPGVDDLAILGLGSGFTVADLVPFVSQDGTDVVISGAGNEIRLVNTQLADLGAGDVLLF